MTAATAAAETFDPATARQVLAPPDGYLWAATTRLAGLPVAGWWWGTERQQEGEFFRAEITGAVFS